MKKRPIRKRIINMASPVAVDRDGNELYLHLDGLRIAKRGHPGTPEEKTWVSLLPGYEAVDLPDGNVEVRIRSVR